MSCMVAKHSELLKLCSRFAFIVCDDITNEIFMSSSINDALWSSSSELYLVIGLLALSGVAMGGPTQSCSGPGAGGSLDKDVGWQWSAVRF
jgi:hypothetical protein